MLCFAVIGCQKRRTAGRDYTGMAATTASGHSCKVTSLKDVKLIKSVCVVGEGGSPESSLVLFSSLRATVENPRGGMEILETVCQAIGCAICLELVFS